MDLFLFSNELPGEDLNSVLRRLHFLSKQKRHAYLAEFLQLATAVFRAEIRRLPQADRAQCPYIESILELCNHGQLRKGRLAGAVDGVILIVLELASFIGCVVDITLKPTISLTSQKTL